MSQPTSNQGPDSTLNTELNAASDASISPPPNAPDATLLLPRPRLLHRLRRALESGPVCLVAPPGYGKSVLLREFAAHQPGTVLLPLRPAQVEIARLQARLSALAPGSTVLVDDTQYLDADEDVQAWLANVVAHDEHGWGYSWLLAGRSIPPRLMAAWEEPTLLGVKDLALTEAETHYLLETESSTLDHATRRTWYTHTGGWPLALALAKHALDKRDRRRPLDESTSQRAESQPKRLDDTSPLTAISGLARRLLTDLPPDLAHYMLVTAQPERHSHALCSELLSCSRSQAAAYQADVIRRNLFLSADEQPGWYRYHDLIREFLIQEAGRRWGEEKCAELLVQAAQWFYRQGDLHAAIDHALAARDPATAARYLNELDPAHIWDHGLFHTYRRWITALSEDIQAQHPRLLVRLGRALLHVGDRPAARLLFARAERYACQGEAQDICWEAQAALAKLHTMDGDLSAALALCEEIIRAAPSDHPARLQALNASGIALTQLNRFQLARHRFEQALHRVALHRVVLGRVAQQSTAQSPQFNETPEQSLPQMEANLHHNLAVGVHIPLGQFEAAEAHLRQNDLYYADRPVARSLHLLAWCGFHENYGDWDGLAQDLAEIEAAEALSEYPDEENIWYFWYKALYHTGVGEYAVAERILDELAPMMVNDEDHLCLLYARAWLLRRSGRAHVSRETALAVLNSPREGPLYRGMLALELLLLDTPLPGAQHLTPPSDGISADHVPVQSVSTPTVDPMPDHLPIHIPSDLVASGLQGLLHVRAGAWLLRLHAHLACTCYAAATESARSKARKHRNRVLQQTGQMFFWRILIHREPELGLRFWLLCLITAAEKPETDGTVTERANSAIQALIQTRNGLSARVIVEAVQTLLEHPFAIVRRQTARLLGDIAAESAIVALAARLEVEPEAEVRQTIEAALTTIESAPPPFLAITLMGEFAVTRGERLISAEDWRRPAVRRLFQYFALHPGLRLSRDRILDDLWPDSPPETARNTFRTLFSWLRRALDPHLRPKAAARYFWVEGDVYCFAPEGARDRIQTDLAVFEETVRSATAQSQTDDLPHVAQDLLDVLENWAPLLPDLPYESWAVAVRERAAGLYVEGTLHVAQALLNLRRDADAAYWARNALAVAPWLEEAYQTLMRAQARQDQRSHALRTYADCVEALGRELDVPPSTLTEWLAQRLRQGEEI